jgi:hypothetical protein
VIVSRHSRLLTALQAKVRISPLRHVTKIPSRQLLYLPHLQNRDARKFFRIRSYEKCRVTSFKPNIFLSPRASRSSDVSRKSLRHNLLSDPHPLNLYPTIFYKNMPGRGYSRYSDVETFQRADNLDPHKSFSCNTYRSPSKCCKQKTYGSARSQLSPVAATLTKNTGEEWGGKSHQHFHRGRNVRRRLLLVRVQLPDFSLAHARRTRRQIENFYPVWSDGGPAGEDVRLS